MSGPLASIVVSPGRVSLDDLAQVLAGAAVVLEPNKTVISGLPRLLRWRW